MCHTGKVWGYLRGAFTLSGKYQGVLIFERCADTFKMYLYHSPIIKQIFEPLNVICTQI